MTYWSYFGQKKKKVKENVFGNFLLKEGLYSKIEITRSNISELADLVGGNVVIDAFCPECGEKRVFEGKALPYYWHDMGNGKLQEKSLEEMLINWQKRLQIESTPGPGASAIPKIDWSWTGAGLADYTRAMNFSFTCSMDGDHHIDYSVITHGNTMIKIGQYPSVADLTMPELKEYRKVISDVDMKEIRRASGLHANGIGIGSFVYLRRIFERILSTAGQEAIKSGKVDSDAFNKARVDEKIQMLSEYLPKTLTESKVFYGIVSKGIHELSEEECLDYFPVMLDFILMILRQWEKLRKDGEDEKEIQASLNKIASKIKK